MMQAYERYLVELRAEDWQRACGLVRFPAIFLPIPQVQR